jgi:protein TonB
VWLAADLAASRLVHRVEPNYPAEALSAHRSGDVVLEVLVNRDGTVASMRSLRGDPLLATAASDAVRNWRYEPYRVRGQPAEFQTDVTLKFSLPD